MAAAPSDFHTTGLNKDDVQISDTGKVAFKNREIAEAIEFELEAREVSTERATTNNCRCINRGCRPQLEM